MIRVLKILEYTYPDIQAMDADMKNWQFNNGFKEYELKDKETKEIKKYTIKSQTFQLDYIPETPTIYDVIVPEDEMHENSRGDVD